MGQRFVLGLLLLCVGGVAPLTYFTPLSPHELPVYYISILEPSIYLPDASALPAEIRELLNHDSSPQLFTAYPDSLLPLNFGLGVSQSFQFNLSQGYLLPVIQGFLPLLFLTRFILAAFLNKCSAWLPLLDKPPRFCRLGV